MPGLPTTRGPVITPEVAASVAQEILRRTGVALTFYLPDGRPLGDAEAAGGRADTPAADLARETAAANQDRVEVGTDQVTAAWPIRVRERPVLVAAARLPVSGEAEVSLARRLLAAVADAVRARVDNVVARAECDSVAEALAQSFEEISLLHNLGKVLRVTCPAAELLDYVCSELCETTGAEAAVAYVPGLEGDEPEMVMSGRLPFPPSDLPDVITHLLDGVGPEECVLINNRCQDDPYLASRSMALTRLVMVPLWLGEGVRGAIVAFNRGGEEFGSPDAKLIRSSANASAVFIDNRRLYSELQQMMLDLIRSLVSSVDAKDPYTCGHSSRVAVMSREIARQLALREDQVEQAYMAGLLHDIGKIGTPEFILQKEGSLQPEERKIIEQHPGVGGRILQGIRKLETVRQAVIHHHERLDGHGYPGGLEGDAIPLLARVVGLADAFDAMTSNRPYRPMLPLAQVVREIEVNTGTQFDPRVAEAFFHLDMDELMRTFIEQPAAACTPTG